MKKFILKILIFTLPAIFIIISVIYIDFFKIFGFQDYFSKQKIAINRGMITTTTYNHFRKQEKFNSFILGSSRSEAYKCKNWISYLDENAKPFHFDASGESIWGISKKVEYIDELGDTIKNALVVIDRSILRVTHPRDGHLFVPMPCVSKSSAFESHIVGFIPRRLLRIKKLFRIDTPSACSEVVHYYFTFLKASLNPKFLIANLDYSMFKTYRKYMGYLIRKSKYDCQVNNKNCDIWYGWDKEIECDSLGFYNTLIEKGVFYKRPRIDLEECIITPDEKKQLLAIKTVFEKHNTNYKIIISPLYDQVPMEKVQIELLEHMFGKKNIYNFSGKNRFTEPIDNFYETSHYRPHVANEIMKIIYQE